ncbi:hypothetical protein AB0C77_31600 [Streptomyces sp. NPDC048629]|uniref:hypothetical protein n=1 Tax=Streptomyces sp. NPDC048629 TaxID=3154824 RepID=UPI003446B52A
MITARLNRIAAAGTVCGSIIRLGDGHVISVKAAPDATFLEEVFLWPGLTAPDTEAWENEDTLEQWLTHDEPGGHLYLDVPADAVRELIQDHLGEDEEQDRVDFPPVRFLIEARSRRGHWVVHVEGEMAGRIFREGGVWYARAYGSDAPVECAGAEAAAARLVEFADVAAGRSTTAGQAQARTAAVLNAVATDNT